MEDIKKEVSQLSLKELLLYIYNKDTNAQFLCVDEKGLKYWKEFFNTKLPKLKEFKKEFPTPKSYPCYISFYTDTDNTDSDDDVSRGNYCMIYKMYSPDYRGTNYPYKGIKYIKINNLIQPPIPTQYTGTDEVEQYKHKLLNQ